jgi:hypothetical protein
MFIFVYVAPLVFDDTTPLARAYIAQTADYFRFEDALVESKS